MGYNKPMSRFHFIYGSAGSGKSTYLYKTLTKKAIEEPEKSFYLFVPEQNTLKAQQELIRYSEVHGILNLDVLSFSQYSYRVLEELGVPCPEILDEIGKSLLMRKALQDCRKELSIYRNKLESPGFIRELLGILSEFSEYEVGSGDLRRVAEEAKTPLLRGKLSDLSVILDAFYHLLLGTGENRTIPEELPNLLLRFMDRSRLMEKAVLCFDGYTGFTPVQLSIIGRLAESAESLAFTVTIPKEELFRTNGHYTDLFYLSRETVKHVTDTLTKAGSVRTEDVGPEREALYRGPLSIRDDVDVRVFSLEDPTEEVRFVASQLALSAKGAAGTGDFRYRKAAVAVSDLTLYKEIVKREFPECGIPYFIDDKAPAGGSPVVEMIRSLVLMIRNSYEYEDVITYLRNPYVTAVSDYDTLDLFENLLRAAGLHGRKKLSADITELSYVPEAFLPELPRLEEYRKSHLGSVFSLHDSLKEEGAADQKAKALLGFLEAFFLRDEDLSPEELRFLTLSRELLTRTTALFTGVRMGMKDFSDLIEAGFSEMKAGVVPSTMDMVNVGDLRRSRFDDIDTLYILGANEGLIPADNQGGGIFTDAERMELTERKLELAPDDRHDASIQNFYLYLLMNKPRRDLVITYSLADRNGARMKPSVIMKGLPEPVRGFAFSGEAGLLRLLSEELGRYMEKRVSDPRAEETISTIVRALSASGNDSAKEKLEGILRASLSDHVLEKLSPDTAANLYGSILRGSVTRFEQFARCPMSHFLGYGLGLTERENYDIEAYDIGRLYHKALDEVFTELRGEHKDLSSVTAAELKDKSAETAQKVCAEYNGSVFSSSARNRYIAKEVQKITEKTLAVLKEQYDLGAFRTLGTEHKFTVKDEGFLLTGSIDRVDILKKEEKTYVKIIDYKSGASKFDLGLCFSGLELQLPAYMREALTEVGGTGKEVHPAGMFLYNIKDPILKYGDPKNEGAFRMNGLMSGEKDALLSMDRNLQEPGGQSAVIPAKNKNGEITEDAALTSAIVPEDAFLAILDKNRELMKEDAKKILRGDIAAQPYMYDDRTGCEYCRYREVCGFDRKLGYTFHKIPKRGKKEILSELENT